MECIAFYQEHPDAVDHTGAFLATLGAPSTNACHATAVAVVNGTEEPPLETNGFLSNEVSLMQRTVEDPAESSSAVGVIGVSVAGAVVVAIVLRLRLAKRTPRDIE